MVSNAFAIYEFRNQEGANSSRSYVHGLGDEEPMQALEAGRLQLQDIKRV